MVLLDTNMLLRLVEASHPQHQAALDSVAKIRQWTEPVCIVPQCLFEFWVVATRLRTQNGLGLDPATADGHISHFQKVFNVFFDGRRLLPEWRRLVVSTATTGKKAHDAKLVAAMRVHGIAKLVTFTAA